MWGKSSFGFVKKWERLDEMKVVVKDRSGEGEEVPLEKRCS